MVYIPNKGHLNMLFHILIHNLFISAIGMLRIIQDYILATQMRNVDEHAPEYIITEVILKGLLIINKWTFNFTNAQSAQYKAFHSLIF